MPAGAGGGTSAVPLADQAVKVGAGRRGPSCIPDREPTTMTVLPDSKTYVIAGAGIHGLSTAWHLAMELEARGKGSGKDIVVLDKTAPGAGASGIACGCVRNFYMTEADRKSTRLNSSH